MVGLGATGYVILPAQGASFSTVMPTSISNVVTFQSDSIGIIILIRVDGIT